MNLLLILWRKISSGFTLYIDKNFWLTASSTEWQCLSFGYNFILTFKPRYPERLHYYSLVCHILFKGTHTHTPSTPKHYYIAPIPQYFCCSKSEQILAHRTHWQFTDVLICPSEEMSVQFSTQWTAPTRDAEGTNFKQELDSLWYLHGGIW